MAKINLLPWRAERRKERQREFLSIMLGMVILGAVVVLAWHTVLAKRASDQQDRVALVQGELDKMKSAIQEIEGLQAEKAKLVERMKVIQDLQGNRPIIVRVYDELVRVIPDGVYLKSLKREGDKFTVAAVAETSNQISNFMRNLEASQWFKSPQLSNVVADKSDLAARAKEAAGAGADAAPPEAMSAFNLTFVQEMPAVQSAEEAAKP